MTLSSTTRATSLHLDSNRRDWNKNWYNELTVSSTTNGKNPWSQLHWSSFAQNFRERRCRCVSLPHADYMYADGWFPVSPGGVTVSNQTYLSRSSGNRRSCNLLLLCFTFLQLNWMFIWIKTISAIYCWYLPHEQVKSSFTFTTPRFRMWQFQTNAN